MPGIRGSGSWAHGRPAPLAVRPLALGAGLADRAGAVAAVGDRALVLRVVVLRRAALVVLALVLGRYLGRLLVLVPHGITDPLRRLLGPDPGAARHAPRRVRSGQARRRPSARRRALLRRHHDGGRDDPLLGAPSSVEGRQAGPVDHGSLHEQPGAERPTVRVDRQLDVLEAEPATCERKPGLVDRLLCAE